MTDAKRIAVVSAGLGQPSSTRLLADRLAAATVAALGERGIRAQVDALELRDVAHEITDNLLTGYAGPALAERIERMTTADGLIAVTPIFTTSYSGLFKSFLDVVDPTALTGMPVLLGATGGSERHSLAIDLSMRPLFAYLHADAQPTAVYAASSDWASDSLHSRVDRAGREFADRVAASHRVPVDPFALPAGFGAALGATAASGAQ